MGFRTIKRKEGGLSWTSAGAVADQGRKGPRPPHLEGRVAVGLSAISPHQTGQQ